MKGIKIGGEGKSQIPNSKLLKRAKIMILDDVFPQKELTFPAEIVIQDDTMKQS